MNVISREGTSLLDDPVEFEPLAIVGMSCRFPSNADTLEKYWQLLAEKRSTVSEIPEKRWKSYLSTVPRVASSLRSATRLGSFLSDIEGFDADFFGISVREAECIDPQQRIILELSWEALENAGIVPSSLKGRNVGVYMAANSFDFAQRLMGNLADIKPWTVNGGMLFGIANRVSYALDFRGPSMVVDTACAGSLTALHLACQSLWQREVPLAIVGGVNVMSNPGMMIALDAAGATSPDGRSKAFDKSANGYGRGEGAGIVVLKRLSDAQEAGDRVHAVVKGSGVFQDGRTAGMMAPNLDAQEAMLRQTYERFKIPTSSVGYVEAHGTGTQAGDKAEVNALARTFGKSREGKDRCLLGSAKPNVGHLEAGAGMAGLIKTVLSLKNEMLPPSIHAELNPEIGWTGSGLQVIDQLTPWPPSTSPRRAGISCFGVGGTIAHTIVEEAPSRAAEYRKHAGCTVMQNTDASLSIFPLSARSAGALKDNASRLADWLETHPHAEINAVGKTLSLHRDHLTKRAAVVGTTRGDVIAGLRKVASDALEPCVIKAQCEPGSENGSVWVFSGHGAQWRGMARELLKNEAAFAEVMDTLAPIFEEELGYTPRTAIIESDWSTVERVQALTFAIQIGLSATWRRYGLEPRAVIGHSVGEVAASVVAGALDLRAAARFACRRAAIYQRLAGRGSMAIARISFDEAQRRLANNADVVAAIAASPLAAVISGSPSALDHVIASWKREDIAAKRIASDAAFHSPQLDELLPNIRAAAAGLVTREPNVRLYTTTLPDPRARAERGPDFWASNSRGAVMLVPAVEAAMDDGFALFLEVSSAPIVAPSIRETADCKQREDVTVCATLIPNRPEKMSMMTSLAVLFCHGAKLDWSSLHPSGEFVDLPTMAWQRRAFWPDTKNSGAERSFGHSPETHILLGKPEHVRSTPPLTMWRTHLDFESRPYPGTHPIFGVEIVPAAVLLYSLMEAASSNGTPVALKDVGLITPVSVENPLEVQIILQDGALRISSRPVDDQPEDDNVTWSWTTHTTALIDSVEREYGPRICDVNALWHRCAEEWSWERIEALYRKRGIGGYGFPWRLANLRRGDAEIIASFEVQQLEERRISSWAEILDGALTICPLLLPDDDILRMPSRIDRIAIHGEPPRKYVVHVGRGGISGPNSGECRLHVQVFDEAGQLAADIDGVTFGILDNKAELRNRPEDVVFCEEWRLKSLPAMSANRPRSIIFIGQRTEWLEELIDGFSKEGVSCRCYDDPGALSSINDCLVVVVGTMQVVEESVEDACERNVWTLIETVQTLIAQDAAMNGVRLACITRGVRENRDEIALAQSALWGAARIIAGERSDIWGGLLDLAADTQVADLSLQLLNALSSNTNEDVIAICKAGAHVLRLTRPAKPSGNYVSRPVSNRTALTTGCRADATYLITGGLGALGLEAAQYLIGRGARRLILAGRHGLPGRATWSGERDPALRKVIDCIKEMEAAGVMVVPLELDISDQEAVRSKLSPDALGLPPIRGIVHAAGVFEGDMLGSINRPMLTTVLRPKVVGTMVLHRQFPPGTLDFFVQFSSSGQFGRLTGQTCYAAANSFLDGVARHRNAAGMMDSVSLGWMAWRGIGMSRSIDATMVEARAHGMDAIDTARAISAWHYCNQLSATYAAIFTPLSSRDHAMALPVFSELFNETDEDTSKTDTALCDIPNDNRLEWLVDDVRTLVATELKLQSDNVEVKRSLIDMGVDSLMTVSLRVRLRRRYGFEFPPTLLWNNPSVHAVARFIDHRISSHTG